MKNSIIAKVIRPQWAAQLASSDYCAADGVHPTQKDRHLSILLAMFTMHTPQTTYGWWHGVW